MRLLNLKNIVFKDATAPVGDTANNGQGFFPQDIRALYNVPPELQGAGQTVGILEFSNGFNRVDSENFWKSHGITPPNIDVVWITPPTGMVEQVEASLDVQWVGGIAPKASIIVYEASAGSTYASFAQAVTNTLQYILNDTTRHPSVLSISYGDAEFSFGADACNQWASLIQQLDAKGITVCIASGDQGAYGTHSLNEAKIRRTDAPASAPFAVAVGGTTLRSNGTESAWTYDGNNGGATGGGESQVFANRGVPDISLNADPATGYQIFYNYQPTVVGGTSGATPVFAAIVAMANEQRAKHGLAPISGLRAWMADHHDEFVRPLSVGDNTFNGVTGYDTTETYNLCTGYGSLDATKFINALSTVQPTQPTTHDYHLTITVVDSTVKDHWTRFTATLVDDSTPVPNAKIHFTITRSVGTFSTVVVTNNEGQASVTIGTPDTQTIHVEATWTSPTGKLVQYQLTFTYQDTPNPVAAKTVYYVETGEFASQVDAQVIVDFCKAHGWGAVMKQVEVGGVS